MKGHRLAELTRWRLHHLSWRALPAEVSRLFAFAVSADGAALIAALLASLPLFVSLSANLGFLLGAPITLATLPLALGLQIGAFSLFAAPSRLAPAFGFSIAAVTAACGISLIFLDNSWDGAGYHMSAVNCYLDGWNSLTERCHAAFTTEYPKLSWQFAAAIIKWFPHHGVMTAINVTAFAASVIFTGLALRTTNISRNTAVIFSVLIAASPVVIRQFWTAYVDGIMGSYFLIALACFCLFAHERRSVNAPVYLLGFTASVVSLAAIKIAGALFAGVVAAAALAYGANALRREVSPIVLHRKFVLGLAAAASALVLFSPYGANVVNGRHVLHPAIGDDTAEFIDTLTPACVAGDLPPVMFFKSISYHSRLFTKNCTPDTGFAAPLKVLKRWREFQHGPAGNGRMAGFGPWYPHLLAACVAVLVIYAFMHARRRVWPPASIVVTSAALVVSVLVFPQNWWARYVPQAWLILLPAVMATCAITGWPRRAALGALGGLAAVSVIGHAEANLTMLLQHSRDVRRITPDIDRALNLRVAHAHTGVPQGILVRLERFGLPDVAQRPSPMDPPCTAGLVGFGPRLLLAMPATNELQDMALSEILARRDWTILVAVRDEATYKLADDERQAFADRGVPIDRLAFRGAMAAILEGDRTAFELPPSGEPARLHVSSAQYAAPLNVDILSRGLKVGDRKHTPTASIRLNGVELSPNRRGINLVVFDGQRRFLGAKRFDTFAGAGSPECATP